MKVCVECDKPAHAGRLCNTHYMRVYRARKGPEHAIWRNVIQRCTDPNHPRYHRYGGRGITVSSRWTGTGGFARFIEDVGRRPEDPDWWDGERAYWSIDRIDNDGDYTPDNVRWASPSEQAANREPGYQLRQAA